MRSPLSTSNEVVPRLNLGWELCLAARRRGRPRVGPAAIGRPCGGPSGGARRWRGLAERRSCSSRRPVLHRQLHGLLPDRGGRPILRAAGLSRGPKRRPALRKRLPQPEQGPGLGRPLLTWDSGSRNRREAVRALQGKLQQRGPPGNRGLPLHADERRAAAARGSCGGSGSRSSGLRRFGSRGRGFTPVSPSTAGNHIIC
mmetsp:Transcript_12546/g.33703  ORF Transcript_12546/g.33703 Transcript_12546/m.33703 type:complete len:200 (+) Transcript_12546:898-1497(+)